MESMALVLISLDPSNNVRENETVKITCNLGSGKHSAQFNLPGSKTCFVVFQNTCLKYCLLSDECEDNETFSIQTKVQRNWNKQAVSCEVRGSINETSEAITFNIKVPVNKVELSPKKITANEAQQINLTCKTDYCNPAANITWYKGSSPIMVNNFNISHETGENNLIKTTSVFMYTGARDDNMQNVSCKASNVQGVTVESAKYALNIRYPPSSKPVLILSPPQQPYNNGTNVTLTCQLPGGNPLANLSLNCDQKNLIQNVLNTNTKAISEVKFQIDGTYNNRTCTCIGTHLAQSTATLKAVTLIVNVPVTDVILIPNQITVNISEHILLNCTTDYCNPPANITWYKGTTQINGNNMNTFIDRDVNSLKRTISVYSYEGVDGDNMQEVYCKASNLPSVIVVSAKHRLDVKYPPTSIPSISSIPPNFQFEDGLQAMLICKLPGGNPLASLVLECNNIQGTNANEMNSTAVSRLSVTVNKSFNNKLCTCTASHQLFEYPKSKQETLVVFYDNKITSKFETVYEINEGAYFKLQCIVDGNPLSTITWIFTKNNSVLSQEQNKNESVFEKDFASCFDHGEYKVTAENRRGSMVSASTKLAVKCTPRIYTVNSQTSDKLGIGSNESLQIFVRILLYPLSNDVQWYFTEKMNKTIILRNNSMGYRTTIVKGENEENITLYKENVTSEEFGNYTVIVRNEVGQFERNYQVSGKRPPMLPINFTLLCDNPFAISLTWISNFNGGSIQQFHVYYSTAGNLSSFKLLNKDIGDKGYGEFHRYIPISELYGHLWFKITASNKFGNSSTYAEYCFIKERDGSSDNSVMIAGSAAGGGVTIAVIVVVVVYLWRHIKREKSAKHIERLDNVNGNEEDNSDVDGLKENCMYVSAGPRDDEKPEVVVYAEVEKKVPQMDNSSNLYADVKKSGRQDTRKGPMSFEVKPKKGLFKKDEKAKHRKAKKPKNRPGETDVYENSEDIALSTNVDVNSKAGQKGLNKKEERGYKNKDGLLYVEVKFDGKQGQDNPVIHGEDEKTDYATVEFPMPSALHKASGSEEL